MANSFILQENVLTDNLLIVPEKGRIFKSGFIAIIKEYTLKNAWNDNEKIKRFRSQISLNAYLKKHYRNVEIDFHGTCLEDE